MKITRHIAVLLLGCCLAVGLRSGEAFGLATSRVSIQFRGPLKDAVKKIAADGGLNVVVIGDLDESAELYLKQVPAEEALQTLANLYHLKIDHQGSIWTVQSGRPLVNPEEISSPSPPASPAPPSPPSSDRERVTGKEAKQRVKEIERDLLGKHLGHRGDGDVFRRGDWVVKEGEKVGTVTVYSGTLTVNGEAERDAVVLGGNLEVNGHVQGSAVAIGGGVHLGPHAIVEGDVSAVGGEVTRDEGAVAEGDQTSIGSSEFPVDVEKIVKSILRRRGFGDGEEIREAIERHHHHGYQYSALHLLLMFATFFGLGFLFMLLAPNRMKQIESEVRSEPFKCGLTGLLGLLAMIALTILLAITLIGIPFLFVLWPAAVLAVAMGISAIASEIGNRLPWAKLKTTQAGAFALGLLVLLLVTLVPYLGKLVLFVIVWIAFGAVIRTRFGHRPQIPVAQPV